MASKDQNAKGEKVKREKVLYNSTPCNCGCRGQDPWHKASYRRRVVKLSETEGLVRLPFSTLLVRVTRDAFTLDSGRPCYGLWEVDRTSVVWDK